LITKLLAPNDKWANFLHYAGWMAIENILAEIDSEIARLQQARALLATLGTATTKAGRTAKKAPAKAKTRKKRVLSAEARKKIADAQHRRWDAQKAKAKATKK
jgi:hypothetical protein